MNWQSELLAAQVALRQARTELTTASRIISDLATDLTMSEQEKAMQHSDGHAPLPPHICAEALDQIEEEG